MTLFLFSLYGACNQEGDVLKNFIEDFKKYEVITKKDIETANDSELVNLIQRNIYLNINVNSESSDEDFKKEFYKFTNLQQDFYSTLVLERNVGPNGFKEYGFKTYFYYYQPVGQFSNEASTGYKRMGFPELSKIVDKATNIYSDQPKDADKKFANLDTVFLDKVKASNVNLARIKIIRANPDSFVTKN